MKKGEDIYEAQEDREEETTGRQGREKHRRDRDTREKGGR